MRKARKRASSDNLKIVKRGNRHKYNRRAEQDTVMQEETQKDVPERKGETSRPSLDKECSPVMSKGSKKLMESRYPFTDKYGKAVRKAQGILLDKVRAR